MPRIRDINRLNKKKRHPKVIKWDYEPSERQQIAHDAPERYKLYGGAMGGGKRYWLCAEAVWLSINYPGNRGYLCRHHLVDVKRSTMVTFEKVCPPGAIYRHILDDRIIEFWNGSTIVYGGLGSQEEMERIKSMEFGWFAIDEATETYEEMFTLLASRLRWKLTNGENPPYYGLLASNPEPGWVKKRFVDSRHDNHIFIPALPKDNPWLPEGYDEGLRKMFPEEAAKRYLDGSWDIFEGQVYKEFDRNIHIFSHDIFQGSDSRYFEKFRSIDHGYVNPTCCLWFCVDFDGNLWIYDEHYQSGWTINEHAKEIHRKSGEGHMITLCDPSMFSRTMQKAGRAWSPADEYRDNGIICMRPYGDDGKLTEISGINLVKQRLKAKSLFIHERCRNTINEMIAYKWRKLRLSDQNNRAPEQPVDKENHAMDALRYGVMWRPVNSSKPEMPVPVNSLHYAFLKHKQMMNAPFFAGWN